MQHSRDSSNSRSNFDLVIQELKQKAKDKEEAKKRSEQAVMSDFGQRHVHGAEADPSPSIPNLEQWGSLTKQGEVFCDLVCGSLGSRVTKYIDEIKRYAGGVEKGENRKAFKVFVINNEYMRAIIPFPGLMIPFQCTEKTRNPLGIHLEISLEDKKNKNMNAIKAHINDFVKDNISLSQVFDNENVRPLSQKLMSFIPDFRPREKSLACTLSRLGIIGKVDESSTNGTFIFQLCLAGKKIDEDGVEKVGLLGYTVMPITIYGEEAILAQKNIEPIQKTALSEKSLIKKSTKFLMGGIENILKDSQWGESTDLYVNRYLARGPLEKRCYDNLEISITKEMSFSRYTPKKEASEGDKEDILIAGHTKGRVEALHGIGTSLTEDSFTTASEKEEINLENEKCKHKAEITSYIQESKKTRSVFCDIEIQ